MRRSGISEDQLGALVGGKTPRETDGQRTGVEERTGGNHGRGAHVFLRPAIARALPDEREEEPLQRGARVPQLFV